MLLGTLVLVAGTAAAVNAEQRSAPGDQQRAAHVAEQVHAPRAATSSRACHGDGIRACWETSASVGEAADHLAQSLGKAAGRRATRTCDQIRVGTTGAPLSATACFVRVRFGDHGVFVFVDPLASRDQRGVATVRGARVVVQTA